MASIPLEPADRGILTPPTISKSLPHNLSIYDLGHTDLANYFIGMIYRKRVETMTKQDLEHVPLDASLLSNVDEMVVYSPQKNCLYRYQVYEVPKEIVHQLEGLARAQDFGVGCFNQLCQVLKKEIRDKSISENPEEDFGKGVEGAVAMVSPLEPQQYLFDSDSLLLSSWQRFLCKSVPMSVLTTLILRAPTISRSMLSLLMILANHTSTRIYSTPIQVSSVSWKKWIGTSPSTAIHITSGPIRTGMKESRASRSLARIKTRPCTTLRALFPCTRPQRMRNCRSGCTTPSWRVEMVRSLTSRMKRASKLWWRGLPSRSIQPV